MAAVPARPGPRDLGDGLFTVERLDGTSAYVLAVIEHASYRIRILGVTAHPDDGWGSQMARNLLMDLGGHLEPVRFLLRDRDTKFTAAFDAVFAGAGVQILRSPARAPPANATMERWIGSCRPRTARPYVDLEPASPTAGAARLRGPSQRSQATPGLDQAAPVKHQPAGVVDLGTVRVRRSERPGSTIGECTPAA